MSLGQRFPSHVALHIAGGRFGEGVILNGNHVLTLAQNVFEVLPNPPDHRLAASAITISAGVTAVPGIPTNTIPVQRIYAHDHYNHHTGKFNVAVLRVIILIIFMFSPDPTPERSFY